MVRRRLALAGATFALQIAGLIFTASPAAAATFYVPMHQFNMCGNVCNSGATVATDPVIFFVVSASPRPWVVTTNEVCTPQYSQMVNTLDDYGYTAIRTITKQVGGSCGSYGNAMFMLGTTVAGSNREYTYNAQASGTTEPRKLECQSMTGYLGVFTGCNTHLHPTDSIAGPQATEARTFIATYYSANGRFVGGDFNIVSPPGWSTSYWDMDPLSRATHATPSPSVRIDFIWGDKAHWPSSRSAPNPYCAADDISDHCYVSGSFVVTL